MKSNISILVSCHKPADGVKNDILKTIEVGAALHKTRLETDYHDDTGENISEKNREYCELTAQYWAWKNLDADYYGFFHYRRYFSFKKINTPYDSWGNLISDYFDETTEKMYGLDTETIRSVVERYDIVLPEEKDITKMPNMGKSMKDQYLASGYLHKEDLEIMMDVIREKSPEMVSYAEAYERGTRTVFNNMFIARKEIFMAYCEWLFGILDECLKRMDMSDYSVEALRTPGHLAERLLNIYFNYLIAQNSYTVGRLQTVAFIDTDPVLIPKPAFSQNNVAIALSANDYYVPYVSTLLLSLKEHLSENHNYDILIMSRDISSVRQKQLKGHFSDCPSVTVRFINVSRYGKQFTHLFLRGHFALETYFRLLMPELMENYDKVLYLDSDLIVNADVAELYDTDLNGYLLAAARDADTAGLYNGYEPNKKKYMDDILKIKEPYSYFQAGVILFNLAEFRKTYTTKEMLQFAASYQWELLDQDVLNYLAQGKYRAVDMAWNMMTDWNRIRITEIISRAPKYLRDEYMAAHEAPKIIHYAGPDKPWQQPYADYAEVFWKYAKKSPYYEVMLQRLNVQEALGIYGASRGKVRRKAVEKTKRIADKLFPKYSKRREVLKKILKR